MSTTTTLVAYSERESFDPQTGDPGVLRQEWRIVPFVESDEAKYADRFGYNWRRGDVPFPLIVVEHRYIRRGVEEPWTPFAPYASLDSALEEIPDHRNPPTVPVHPKLAELFARRRVEAAKAQEAERAADERRRELVAQQTKRRDSDAAFVRMEDNSISGKALAEQWRAKINELTPRRDELRSDAAFMAAYRAVLDATTIPSKRKAIKKFLAYVAKEKA